MNIKVVAVVVFICVTVVTAKYPDREKIKLLKRLLISAAPANNGSGQPGAGDANNMSPPQLLGSINDKLDVIINKVDKIDEKLSEGDEGTTETPETTISPPNTTDSSETETTATETSETETPTTGSPQTETSTTGSSDIGTPTTGSSDTEAPTATPTVERRLLLSLLKNLARKRTLHD